MGGAQAIAALAFGTEKLKKVDKIVVLEVLMLQRQKTVIW